MAVTVNINGLSLCHKNSDGFVRSTLPDVCLTPAAKNAPIPYTNIAFSKDLAKGTTSVRADKGAMCAIKGSEFSKSIGDEPGSGGGVKSGVHLHKATWLSWSPNVFMEGKPVCRLTDKMLLNKGNTVSVGGEQQKWLGGDDPIMDKLCEFACECRSVSARQQCMADKIKDELYDGKYPKVDSPIWQEVSMKLVDGVWQIIMNKAGAGPTSNPITPKGGIRPDVVVNNSGKPSKIIEVKFEGDKPNANQRAGGAYDEAAEDLGVERDNLTVEDDCDCGDGGGTAPEPVMVPSPSGAEDEGLSTAQKVGLGAGIAAGIGVIACLIAEPCGAILVGGAALGGAAAAL
ncbi:DUF4150 domain-containing protein [Roseibium sediminis]|uniref:DUF4150 domain-containing protein n=1 Tax=Roseibium sediminis TaxID=1775174 RepID=UPI00123D0656|nr:DUF4150 domain-containing protein [Roseibium sediminis]